MSEWQKKHDFSTTLQSFQRTCKLKWKAFCCTQLARQYMHTTYLKSRLFPSVEIFFLAFVGWKNKDIEICTTKHTETTETLFSFN